MGAEQGLDEPAHGVVGQPVPFEDADTLGELESDVLRALDPPLNLDKVAKNPLRARLSELRRQYSRKKRSG
jgi:hypothetical protein